MDIVQGLIIQSIYSNLIFPPPPSLTYINRIQRKASDQKDVRYTLLYTDGNSSSTKYLTKIYTYMHVYIRPCPNLTFHPTFPSYIIKKKPRNRSFARLLPIHINRHLLFLLLILFPLLLFPLPFPSNSCALRLCEAFRSALIGLVAPSNPLLRDRHGGLLARCGRLEEGRARLLRGGDSVPEMCGVLPGALGRVARELFRVLGWICWLVGVWFWFVLFQDLFWLRFRLRLVMFQDGLCLGYITRRLVFRGGFSGLFNRFRPLILVYDAPEPALAWLLHERTRVPE